MAAALTCLQQNLIKTESRQEVVDRQGNEEEVGVSSFVSEHQAEMIGRVFTSHAVCVCVGGGDYMEGLSLLG